MKKKAIFGGTFNPIHNAHLKIALRSLEELKLDEVIFMPSGNPPHKNEKQIAPANLRYEMVREAIKDNCKFKIDDYEIKREGFSYTYKTLEHFSYVEKDVEWFFIAGLDSLMDLEKWKNVNIILNLCKFIVFNRSGYDKEQIAKQKKMLERKYNNSIVFLDIEPIDISSTIIRHKIRRNEYIGDLVPEKIYDIIKKNKLYV
ncbi:nicotinate-nucleotide adenylyltransferase [Clostridium felsineum]|uniref:Probable nicotinate-nucleotide adenylyltransferase n=1 Tax=Clostridium felsineum TaxID=36839 RepID=A0A1S8LAA5_9CLOT|nr:nicotinate-nucleotide adenylyltransferase [Clostridium felsineum]MCR3758220.1 nicotinate-nucleotide adenylyltransferase [Clostridium felsineum]URZ01174.1 Nicotinate-nucleotide adenylyltransferase [Clostridium felsineum]URZ06071.1 Nicotinate-nucleotide adenylyltransferase [Clostridium felsineum]URZ11108.1 Nicotinate-nucleotide adenylyltransferase [Clostridium felsineum]URZ15736.1 Nicotinate-nucleotide adenylyltransferase [Clostridium felsineum DSM 794]